MATVLVPLAQGCEELEAVTIIDLLRRAGIHVTTAGLDDQPVRASRGTVLIPDSNLDTALNQEYDMLVLPGGLPGADYLNQDSRIQALIRSMTASGKYMAAICAAPRVFATAGILKGRRATSFPGALDGFSMVGVIYEASPVVIDGKLITSRSPGTAMDFSLTLIELLVGKAKRDSVEQALQRPAL